MALLGTAVSAHPLALNRPLSTDTLAASVTEASQRFGIPEPWIYAVIRVESAGHLRAVSRAGAQGLMQIMPATWAHLRARYSLGADVFDIHDNIIAGTAYLRELYDRYGTLGMVATYNAGAGRYEDYRDHGRALPAETQRYVARLSPALFGDVQLATVLRPSTPVFMVPPRASWTQSGLFTARQISASNASTIDRPSAPELHSTNRQTAYSALNQGLFVAISHETPQ